MNRPRSKVCAGAIAVILAGGIALTAATASATAQASPPGGAPQSAGDVRRHGAASATPGLPRTPGAFAPYHAEPDHVRNRVFRSLWLRELQPAEVGAPADAAPVEWTARWVHRKRAGTAADVRWFGGDGRQLPLDALPDADAAALRRDLETLVGDAAELAALRRTPALAVLFQHDLLRAAERLLDVGGAPELVALLRDAAFAVALPADTLTELADPLRDAIAAGAFAPDVVAALPVACGGRDAAAREVTRRSTRLFDAGKTLAWSRVFLTHPDGAAALAALLPRAADANGDTNGDTNTAARRGPTVPVGFRAVLVQGIVAVDRDGAPRATPLVVDLRLQHLANRAPLGPDNATFTHDGVDFRIWQLERESVRRGDAAAGVFREVGADDHDLFRDYGTAKHTTYRGQCTLCHRTSDTPEPELGGFPVLRPHARAALASSGDERLQRAETEVRTLLQRLAAAK